MSSSLFKSETCTRKTNNIYCVTDDLKKGHDTDYCLFVITYFIITGKVDNDGYGKHE